MRMHDERNGSKMVPLRFIPLAFFSLYATQKFRCQKMASLYTIFSKIHVINLRQQTQNLFNLHSITCGAYAAVPYVSASHCVRVGQH